MKKNIIQILPTLSTGGAESIVRDYALFLDKEKFNIKIICLWGPKDTANEHILRNNNIDIIYISKKFKNKLFTKIYNKLFITKNFEKILKKETPDIIHMHMVSIKFLKIILKNTNFENTKLFYTIHNEPTKVLYGFKNNKLRKELIKQKQINIIALHNDMKNQLNSILKRNNSIIIRNGIDMNKFSYTESKRKNIRKELNIPEEAFVIGNIGRFSISKNHEFIIEIFTKIIKDYNNKAILLLVGKGNLKNKIIKKINEYNISNNVIILENRKDIPEILSCIDVFFMPSINEGFPVTLVEAQAIGVKCIVSNNINEEVFLTDLIKSLSLEDTEKKWIEALLENKSNLTYLNKNQLELYDIRKEIKRLENLYEGVLDE